MEETFKMAPLFRAIIGGRTARVIWRRARMFTFTMSRTRSHSLSSKRPWSPRPALFQHLDLLTQSLKVRKEAGGVGFISEIDTETVDRKVIASQLGGEGIQSIAPASCEDEAAGARRQLARKFGAESGRCAGDEDRGTSHFLCMTDERQQLRNLSLSSALDNRLK